MKRALWITLIAVALLTLAAVGWVARRVERRRPAPGPAQRPSAVGQTARSERPLEVAVGR